MIWIQNVSKSFSGTKVSSLRESPRLTADSSSRSAWALQGIDFRVGTGEFVSLIGPNGSGKSTLLQIVAGTLTPTTGRVLLGGRIAALLELGAGFSPELTGRENVLLSAGVIGVSRKEIEARLPEIEEFADIGEYFDRPVKQYSSGMYVRLAFASAIHVDPEILIVDEALAVGDAIFANRCIRKFEELRAKGTTVFFVSHDMGLVKRLSDRVIFLLNGRIQSDGPPAPVVDQYVGYVLQNTGGVPEITAASHGDGSSAIERVELLDDAGRAVTSVCPGARIRVVVQAAFAKDVDRPVVGFLVRNRHGVEVCGTNTRVEGIDLGGAKAGEKIKVEFGFDCRLVRNDYTLTVATQHWSGHSQNWINDALEFSVTGEKDMAGFADVSPVISWSKQASL